MSSSVPLDPARPAAEPAPAAVAAPTFSAPAATALGWALLVPVNLAFVFRHGLGKVGLGSRLLHAFYDAFQLIGVGLAGALLVAAWKRWAPRKLGLEYLAVALLAFLVGLATLPGDVAGVVQDLGGASSRSPIAFAVIAAVSLTIPAALGAGRLLHAKGLGAFGLGPSLVAAVANHLVLARDYRGLHLFLGWTAATLAAASIAGLRRPPLRAPTNAARTGLALLGAASLVALFVRPSNVVRVEMGRVDGAVIAPLVARLRFTEAGSEAAVPPELRPWFEHRAGAPPVPAGPPLAGKSPIVVLVTIDSFRAELLSDPAYREKLPRMHALLEASTQFTQARAPGSFTRTSIGSMMTGKYNSQLHWGRFEGNKGWLDKDRSVRFPELLGKAGVRTVNVVSYADLVNKIGIARGFAEEQLLQPTAGQRFPLAPAMVDAAIPRIDAKSERPQFLYMHWMDAHYPYDAGGTAGSLFDRYVAELALCDKELGRLVDALKEKGAWDRTVLLVGADHGEAFGQHDTRYHGLQVYEELLRVPLFIRVPGDKKRTVEAPVSLIDVGPTVLDLFGVETPGVFMGQSLAPFLRGEAPVLTRPIVAEWWWKHALVLGKKKAILDDKQGTVEIYDLEQDPKETQNLADSLPETPEADLLRAFLQVHTEVAGEDNAPAPKKRGKKKPKKKKAADDD